jgi:hypothetical protein
VAYYEAVSAEAICGERALWPVVLFDNVSVFPSQKPLCADLADGERGSRGVEAAGRWRVGEEGLRGEGERVVVSKSVSSDPHLERSRK